MSQTARTEVISAIRQASSSTGIDFDYLLTKASAESSLNPQAQASTSSARGLYQFIENTWLDTLDKHGAKHGLGDAAAAITRNSKGQPVVQDPQMRQQLLSLRDDPKISSLMAAELAHDNQNTLEHKLGRKVGNAELYMAHFLGAGGAAKFLSSLDNNPQLEANNIVPAAAKANQAVFYKAGKALTLDQVFNRFASKFAQEPVAQQNRVTASVSSALASKQIATVDITGTPTNTEMSKTAFKIAATPQENTKISALENTRNSLGLTVASRATTPTQNPGFAQLTERNNPVDITEDFSALTTLAQALQTGDNPTANTLPQRSNSPSLMASLASIKPKPHSSQQQLLDTFGRSASDIGNAHELSPLRPDFTGITGAGQTTAEAPAIAASLTQQAPALNSSFERQAMLLFAIRLLQSMSLPEAGDSFEDAGMSI